MPGAPLNVPIVLASTFRAASFSHVSDGAQEDDARRDPKREYARDDATPSWEAFEAVIGEVEGGQAAAFSSGMAPPRPWSTSFPSAASS